MAVKNKVQVMIEGRVMTLMGSESEEYMLKVAAYIDEKMREIRKSDKEKALNAATASVLTSINIADDYFKEVEKNKLLSEKNKELLESISNDGKVDSDQYEASLKEIADLKETITILEEEKAQVDRELDEYISALQVNMSNSAPKIICKPLPNKKRKA